LERKLDWSVHYIILNGDSFFGYDALSKKTNTAGAEFNLGPYEVFFYVVSAKKRDIQKTYIEEKKRGLWQRLI
jgi:hypothetical protein